MPAPPEEESYNFLLPFIWSMRLAARRGVGLLSSCGVLLKSTTLDFLRTNLWGSCFLKRFSLTLFMSSEAPG